MKILQKRKETHIFATRLKRNATYFELFLFGARIEMMIFLYMTRLLRLKPVAPLRGMRYILRFLL